MPTTTDRAICALQAKRVTRPITAACWLVLALGATASAQSISTSGMPSSAPSVKRGQTVFETRCVACHAIDTNRAGPALRGVVGRLAGKAPAFFYSEALESATHVWDRNKLKLWPTSPEKLVPGQEMNFHLDSAREREDVVAYLATLSRRGQP